MHHAVFDSKHMNGVCACLINAWKTKGKFVEVCIMQIKYLVWFNNPILGNIFLCYKGIKVYVNGL